ncbi:lipopolysaccharide biosynthesis protein [Geodermatophilus sp. URMC 62]|uniref:lipopolysaccharide biosynthesis protein n=1 Tax=Geodermatophilus sp. URMC 62 TaxID=3423414 RepID=UPI00406D0805
MSDSRGGAPVRSRPRLPAVLTSAGARSGLVLLVCSLAGHVGNYLYYVLAARLLTPAEFAEVSAITGLATIAFMPATGVQAALARDTAALEARGLDDQARALGRAVARRMAVVQAAVLAVLVLATPAAVAVLDLGSAWVWLVGAAWLVLGMGLYVGLGSRQGREQFGRVAAVLGGPMGVFRPLFLVPLALVAGVVGALGAMVAATVVGLAVLAERRRDRPVDTVVPPLPDVRTALVALGAFASLTNIDLLVGKVTLGPTEAGLYASAALLGKVALYGPSALALLLLPKVTARLESGLSVRRPALLVMAATVLTGGVVAAAIALAPASLVTGVFGAAYAGAYSLAAPLAVAMTLLALVHVHIMVSLARRDRVLIGVVALAAAAQAAGLLLLGSSPGRIVLVTTVVAATTLAVHELTSPYGLVRLALREPAARRPTPVPDRVPSEETR